MEFIETTVSVPQLCSYAILFYTSCYKDLEKKPGYSPLKNWQ